MGVTRDGPAELALAFVSLNRYMRGGEFRTAGQRLVELAVETVPGCDWASIASVPPHRPPRSVAHSAEVAGQVDALQARLGDGPSITAAVSGDVVHVADLGRDVRWRQFTAAALAATQVRSLLAIPLVDRSEPSALTLYSATQRAFDSDAIDLAALFAAHARVLLMHADTADQAGNLGLALNNSRQIGTAVGILMGFHGIDADAAFDLLRTASQNLNRKLRDVAEEVTMTGTLPGTPTTS